MFGNMEKHKQIDKAYDKIKKVILSCRTGAQICVSTNMIEQFSFLFPDEISLIFDLTNISKKRLQAITSYANCLEGDEVYILGNQDETAFEATVVKFDDFGKEHQSFLPIVKGKDGKDYMSMGVLLPKSIYNDKDFLKTLNAMDYKERWNKYSKGVYKME